MTTLPCILIERKLDGMLCRAERDMKKAKKLFETAMTDQQLARVAYYLVNVWRRLLLIRLRCLKWLAE